MIRRLRWLLVVLIALGAFAQAQRVGFLTFNDVYELQGVDSGTRGGAAAVATVEHQVMAFDPHTLVLFAGDLLSPSVMSNAFKGKQMVEALNRLGVDYATLGNHEFDFGLSVLKQRIQESDFTWLSSNILDSATGKPIAGTQPDAIVDVNGVKIGLFGVAYDFSSILADASAVTFKDPITTAQAEVKKLKAEGAQYIVALTHEAKAQDCELSAKVSGIDLIVGGHDHAAMMDTQCGHAPYIKATSDWRNVWDVNVDFSEKSPIVSYRNIPVTDQTPKDPGMQAFVQSYVKQLDASFSEVLGKSIVTLDAIEKDVRAKETNLGDFIAGAIQRATHADVAIMNGGGIRTDRSYPAGPITKKDVYAILPFGNSIVVVKAKGSALAAALENGVSQRKDLAGRFPQVAGVRFVLHPNQPVGQRVSDIQVDGKPLDPNATYTVAINDYMFAGGDGYTMFKGLPTTLAPSEGPLLAAVVADAIKADGTIAPKTDGRITIQ
jgi:2',3'-cyclic-nucleotide 2'-phosphodiesterase (5'-nucleotidase family)